MTELSYASTVGTTGTPDAKDAKLVPTIPGLMDAVPSKSFFSTSTSSTTNSNIREIPKSKQPVKRSVMNLKPRIVDDHETEDEEEIDELDSSPTINQKNRNTYTTSSTRTTSIPIARPLTTPITSTTTDWTAKPTFQSDTSMNATQNETLTRPFGPGHLTPKVLALFKEKGGYSGIWQTAVWDFKILDPDQNKYPAYGTLPPLISVATATNGNDTITTSTTTTAPTDEMIEAMEMSNPRHRTTTIEELQTIRPHPNAFYSRGNSSWAVFTPISHQPVLSWSGLSSDRPHMWRVVGQIRPESLNIIRPIDPARPTLSEWHTTNAFNTTLDDLTEIRSSKGDVNSIAYSSLDFIPTIIPKPLWEAFSRARSQPLPGQSVDVNAVNSWKVLWRLVIIATSW
jgi:hypothetical protein